MRDGSPDPLTGAEACALYFASHTSPDSPEWEQTHLADWINHYKLRLAYENQMIEAAGGRALLRHAPAGQGAAPSRQHVGAGSGWRVRQGGDQRPHGFTYDQRMTLGRLREELAKLAHLHPLTETGIDELVPAYGYVAAVCEDLTGLSGKLEEAERQVEGTERQLEEAEMAREAAEELEIKLRRILDNIRNDGGTVLEYQQRAEAAEEIVRRQRPIFDAAQRELTALRKRRGLMAGYYAHGNDVMAYLHNSKDPAAQALVTKIHAAK